MWVEEELQKGWNFEGNTALGSLVEIWSAGLVLSFILWKSSEKLGGMFLHLLWGMSFLEDTDP